MMRHSNNGGPVPGLWCVELVPKLKKVSAADAERVVGLAKGMPSDPGAALAWVAEVICGLVDQRGAEFARDRRRLVVFKVKRRAAERARRETNEFWSGRVRAVKVV